MLMFGKVLGFCALPRFVKRWAWQTATRSDLIMFEKPIERKDMDGQAFYVVVIISFFLGSACECVCSSCCIGPLPSSPLSG
jgi:hypothetical protein